MRQIDFIVLHCTASPQSQTVAAILAYWKSKGWKRPGYHHLIDPSGKVHDLLPIETPSNGAAGHNYNSIHISYIGGVQTASNDPVNAYGTPIDNRTTGQKTAMQALVEKYSLMFPKAVIQGHRDFSPDKDRDGLIEPHEWIKACPSFSVKTWLREIGFKSKLPEIPENLPLVTTAWVNIREGAGVEFKTVAAALQKGTQVKKIGEAGDWTYVSVGGVTGWILSKYLTAGKSLGEIIGEGL